LNEPGLHAVHTLNPEALAKVPWLQAWHTDCPVELEKKPAAHLVHKLAFASPVVFENVPTGHLKQAVTVTEADASE
jgi:hypothetical protein